MGEALGFLAARPAEHQPGETEQRERPGGDRDPLRDRRRRQRLSRQSTPCRPGGVGEPQGGYGDQPGAEHLPSAGAARFGLTVRPLLLVERRLYGDLIGGELEWPLLLDRRGERLGELRCGVHGNDEFTIFVRSRKRLESGCETTGARGMLEWRWER